MRARFGGVWTLDTEARELTRAGRRVALSAKAIDLLATLIARRPEAVSQAALKDALWPDAHVGYTSLARVVSEARHALGEAADRAAFVRTVPRYGYAFVGDVVMERGGRPAESRFLLVADERDFVLPPGEVLLGRGAECVVRLPSTGVSRVHARLQVGDGGVVLDDRGSKNGTWVNGARITGRVELREGDEILLGTYRVVFRTSGALESTRTAAPGPPR